MLRVAKKMVKNIEEMKLTKNLQGPIMKNSINYEGKKYYIESDGGVYEESSLTGQIIPISDPQKVKEILDFYKKGGKK